TRDTWYKLVDEIHKKNPNATVWQCLYHFYKVCTLSIISSQSREAWNLYNRINGAANETYESYQRLPVRWRTQINIIENEMAHIDELKRTKK
ncbi:hypothetical protein LCGC14_2862460, partial [marine sediment metagenome]